MRAAAVMAAAVMAAAVMAAAVMAALAGRVDGRVCDQACGCGHVACGRKCGRATREWSGMMAAAA